MPTPTPLRHFGRRIAAAACLAAASLTAVAMPPGTADDIAASDADPHGDAWAMPLDGARVTSGFAKRRHPTKKRVHHHEGVDFAAPRGAPVRAVDDGVVTFAGTQAGYGNVVYIRHAGRDRTTLYAHLDRIDVRKDQPLRQGAPIGTVGSTGLATGPHLHFEVHEGGRPIDPMTLAYRAVATPRGPDAQAPATVVARAADAARDSARCIDLLQKASLEALDVTELDFLRQGCIR